MRIFGHCELSEFLNNHWQVQPLKFPKVFPDLVELLNAEEALELAGSEGITGGLLLCPPEGEWQLVPAPIDPDEVDQLEVPWTLTVRELERHYPELDEVLARFSFIPGWQLGDLSLSLTSAGTPVGPYLCESDRFVVNLDQSATWETQLTPQARVLPELPVDVVEDFNPGDRMELQLGDMIYLPRGYSYRHNSSLVFTLSCFAPSRAEMVADLLRLSPENPSFTPRPEADQGACLSAATMEAAKNFVAGLAHQPDFEKWFGCYVTANPRPLVFPPEEAVSLRQFKAYLADCRELEKSIQARWAYCGGETPFLFVDGRALATDLQTARVIAENSSLEVASLAGQEQLLCDLYNAGYVTFPD